MMQISDLSYIEELKDSSKVAILGGDSDEHDDDDDDELEITFNPKVTFPNSNNSIIVFGVFVNSPLKIEQRFERVQAGGEGGTGNGEMPGMPSSPSVFGPFVFGPSVTS